MSPNWMFAQVKAAAGIHMSTFKDKDEAPEPEAASGDGDAPISGWTPSPAFFQAMRRSQSQAVTNG